MKKPPIYLGTFPKVSDYYSKGLTLIAIGSSVPTKYKTLIKHSIKELIPPWYARNLDIKQKKVAYEKLLSKLRPRDVLKKIYATDPDAIGYVLLTFKPTEKDSQGKLLSKWVRVQTGKRIKVFTDKPKAIDPKLLTDD